MKFEEFLKHYLTPGNGSLVKLSRFKHENELDYARFRDRARHVEEFCRTDTARSHQLGKFTKPLTPENFKQYEEYANSMARLTGKEIKYSGSTMQDKFNRLTDTEQQDIYYHCLLQGRLSKDGTANYTQSDFDWLKSEDYQHVLDIRKAENAN